MIPDKDFSIFLETASTTNGKKDFAVVSGYNSIVQQIQHVCRTQQSELVSDTKFGSRLYEYIYTPNIDKGLINLTTQAAIKNGVPKLSQVNANLSYYSDTIIKFDVTFSMFDGIKSQSNMFCSIEVPL